MHVFTFEGIGTHWKVLFFVPSDKVDDVVWERQVDKAIKRVVDTFDYKYSRFKKESLVWQIAQSQQTQHYLSDEFADILKHGDRLRKLTNGRFNPAVGFVLEHMGYDTEYSFQEKKSDDPIALDWELKDHRLHTPQPILIDIGAWGKGYLIDLVAKLLETKGISHYLVDGGGDVFATQKPDGSAWRVPIVHPLNSLQAFAVVEVQNFALACTGSTLRTFGKYHHLVDPQTRQSVHHYLGVYTQAKNATIADGAATALFVDHVENTAKLARELSVDYLTLTPELKWKKSSDFLGDVFVE